uniref:DUF6506 family protein n=1 Tax=Candidatus Fimivicinus sp. TaxID=3056640 RepID=UPI003FF128F8
MRFADIMMGEFIPHHDWAGIHDNTVQIVGVSNLEEACFAAQKLYTNGVDCIELCGAFWENGAKTIIKATGIKIPVGYVIHLPEQDSLFLSLFI